MASLQLLDLFETTVSSAYTAGGTTLTLTSVAGLPATGDYYLSIFDPASPATSYEVFKVTGPPTGQTIPVTGAQATTTAKSHAAGQTVFGSVLTAAALTQFKFDTQSPWLQNINAAAYTLSNVSAIPIGPTAAPILTLSRNSGSTTLFVNFNDTTLGADTGMCGINCYTDPATSDSAKLSFTTRYLGGSGFERMHISGRGNIGMGVSNPQYHLDVAGDINTGGVFRVNGVPISTGGQPQTPWAQDINAASFNLNSVKGIGIGTNAAAGIGIYCLSSTISDIFTHTNLTTTSWAGAVFGNNASKQIAFRVYGSAHLTYPNLAILSSDVDLALFAASAERMRITAAGLVGIGKTPAYALDVSGDVNITGTYRVNGTPISTGGAAQTPWTSNINAANFALTSVSAINIGTASGLYPLWIHFNTDNNLAFRPSSTTLAQIFAVSDANSAYKALSIEGVPLILNAAGGSGNVGIGTVSPQATLDVNGPMRSMNGGNLPTNGVGLEAWYNGVGGAIDVYDRTAGAFKPLGIDGSALLLNANSHGYVGINTPSPNAILHAIHSANYAPSLVFGGACSYIFNTSNCEIAIGCDTASPFGNWMQSRVNGTAAHPLIFQPLGGVVGIGTRTPTNNLHIWYQNVAGADGGYAVNIDRNYDAVGDWTGIKFGGAGPNGSGAIRSLVTAGAQIALTFHAQGTLLDGASDAAEVMRVRGDGCVGIGQTNPTQRLDIVSFDNNDSTGFRILPQNLSQSATYGFGGISGTYFYKIQTATNQYLALQPAGGKVSIGNLAPGYALDVTGDVNISGTFRVAGVPISTGSGGVTTQSIQTTATRVLGTLYRNTSGKAMYVCVSCSMNNTSILGGYSDTSSAAQIVAQSANTNTAQTGVVYLGFWVINGSYYKVAAASGTVNGNFSTWVEWT